MKVWGILQVDFSEFLWSKKNLIIEVEDSADDVEDWDEIAAEEEE
jgi:hypothetical protein